MVSWVKLPSVFGGRSPERPIPGKWSSTTRFVWLSQTTPGHVHGVAGWEMFQSMERPPTEERMARMADLSAERSGLTARNSEKRRKRMEGAWDFMMFRGTETETDHKWIFRRDNLPHFMIRI